MRMSRHLTLFITCLSSVSLAAHDVLWNDDYEESHLQENLESLKDAQEALLKLKIYSMNEGRQYSSQMNEDLNFTVNISQEKFENIVVKINSEVSLLRNQALILSKAYRDLMAKHKTALKAIDRLQESSYDAEKIHNFKDPGSQPMPISSSPPAPACSCNCVDRLQDKSHESYIIGNKYYYYNFFTTQNDLPKIPQAPWEHKISSPVPKYHHTAEYSDAQLQPIQLDWNDRLQQSRPTSGSSLNRNRNANSLAKDKIASWKSNFFERHDLEALEKLFSDSEAQALLEQ